MNTTDQKRLVVFLYLFLREVKMRVRVIYNYYDRELGFEKKIGDEIEVSDERGQTLIAAEVAEEIIGEQKEESSEE